MTIPEKEESWKKQQRCCLDNVFQNCDSLKFVLGLLCILHSNT